MHTAREPWVEIGPFSAIEDAGGEMFARRAPRVAWRGVFACQVFIRPFADLEDLRRGFNLEALVTESFDRQRLFLESQHYPGEPHPEDLPIYQRRTFALRYITQPGANRLTILLMGKALGATPEEAAFQARRYCRELCSIFPLDYEVAPIESQEEFRTLTHWSFIEELNAPTSMAEVERYEGIVSTGQERFYLLGGWNLSRAANEQIWRMLAGMECLTIYSVTLQPTIVLLDELAALHSIAEHLEKIAAQVNYFNVKPYAEYAARLYGALLKNYRRAYLTQTRLLTDGPTPEYAPRAVGFALTHTEESEPATPGFQISQPQDLEELNQWKSQVLWLSPGNAKEVVLDRRFARLRRIAYLEETMAMFRLPYALKGGIPGVALTLASRAG